MDPEQHEMIGLFALARLQVASFFNSFGDLLCCTVFKNPYCYIIPIHQTQISTDVVLYQ